MTISALRPPEQRDRNDALAWAVISLAALALLPIGAISGDGLGQSASYASGRWFWNPNHLLYEPLGAWWQSTMIRLGVPRTQPDQLTLLSIVAGSFSLGVFRVGVAAAITPSRSAANVATAWVAMCAAWAALWVSQEAQMLQMPFLALAAGATLAYFRAPSSWKAAAIGGATAAATLFYVSNILLAATLGLAVLGFHARRKDVPLGLRRSLILGLVAGLVVFVGFGLAWRFTAPEGSSLITWLTSYRGGIEHGNLTSTFGMKFTVAGVALAAARAAYGTALAMVDITPLVDAARSRSPSLIAAACGLAFAAAAAVPGVALMRLVLRRHDDRAWGVLAMVVASGVAVLAFGVYWNNSDDQFYFQLALPLGALVAWLFGTAAPAPAWRLVALAALLWNAMWFTHELVLYPRAQYVREVSDAVAGASLVVFPGDDETARILYFVSVPEGQRRLAIAGVANRSKPAEGLSQITDSVEAALSTGGRVVALGVFDATPNRPPWKQLAEVGFTAAAIREAVARPAAQCGMGRAGPFTVRSCARQSPSQ